ncbi:Carnitine O-acetyltransferase mitochondrial [Ceratobasidium sp. 428]|nr:Carnitine O-acetyltransferase mitochondrial [Ceratobasidium sp. 428]
MTMLVRVKTTLQRRPQLSLRLQHSSAMVTRPADWKARAPAPLPNTKTFTGEATLPSLPVPDLDASLDRLKVTLRPLARSSDELKIVEAKIEELRTAGLGRRLHERLLQRKEEKDKLGSSWLEEWWDDVSASMTIFMTVVDRSQAAYLTYRDSVVVNVSYYYGFTPHPSHLPQSPVHRAAALTRSAMLFRQKFKRGELAPDATKEGPFCMDTWRWMFDCCRVPATDGKDFSVSFAKAGDTGDSGHIVVIRNGRLWKVDAAAPGGGLLGTEELERQFAYIYENSKADAPGVGVLTSNNRDVWAKDYDALREIPANAEILREIESCAFIVCLDAGRPESPVDFSRACWHGGVKGEELGNRWVDKPCQFIVFDNGVAGFMGEHSVMDGTPTVRLCDEVLTDLHSSSFPHEGAKASSPLPSPTPLDFTLTPALNTAIQSARTAASDLVGSQALQYLLVPYGKDVVKTFNVSPDSWAQLMIQLAFWRLSKGGKVPGVGGEGRGELAGTYEAATTRKFRKGRTETIRVVSDEVKAFCEAMDAKDVPAEKKIALFRDAAKVHIQRAKEAGNAMGVDRHMFGLKHLIQPSEGESMPALFSDPLYQRAAKWTLSTSAIFSKHFPVYGWGEVVPDGFGIAYMTGYNDRMQFTITSRKEMPSVEFKDEIDRAAKELRELFDVAQTQNKSRL